MGKDTSREVTHCRIYVKTAARLDEMCTRLAERHGGGRWFRPDALATAVDAWLAANPAPAKGKERG